ncbi:MAG: PAS domain S-box protein [Planctomycetota bacterium]|nr:PAS domain S-box protein [Planctomycetota bacterium]
MRSIPKPRIVFSCLALMLGSFAIDILLPLGVAAGILHAIVVLLSVTLRRIGYVAAFASLGTLLTVAGYFLKDPTPGIAEWIVVVNRGLSILGIWGAVLLSWFHLRSALELERSRERLRGLMDTAVDGVITIDERGLVQSYNQAAERIFGYAAEEVVGRNVSMLMPPPYHGEHDGYLRNYFRTGAKKIIGIGREVEGRRKDGSVFPLDLAVSELRIDEGRVFLGLVRDITTRKAQEAQLRDYAQRLERSNRELESFASVASHDLQEPLRKVVAFGQRLRAKLAAEADPEAQDYLKRMTDAAQRMQQLINDLLSFSRVTSKAQPFVPVDLGAVVREVVEDLETRIEKEQGRVTVGPLPDLDADPLQMRQLFQNLIGNALKFRRPGVPPEVTIEGRRIEAREGGGGVPSGRPVLRSERKGQRSGH